MAPGDGIRRNIATVTDDERKSLRVAILGLHDKLYPGSKTDEIPGGVSYWFKQDETHDSTHVHSCPAFLPWHRELINRFEQLLREIDPTVSLHYWDWTQDPTHAPNGNGGFVNFFTPGFMGNAIGPDNSEIELGEPWSKFYGGPGPFRDQTGNPADPPQLVTRRVGAEVPLITVQQDKAVLAAPDFVRLDELMEGGTNSVHTQAHNYIGGSIRNPHTSFRDPFVFLLHSNVDRLFAMWQHDPRHPERLDPTQVYRAQSTDQRGYQFTKGGDRTTADPPRPPFLPSDADVEVRERPWWGILSPLEPWAGPGDSIQTAASGIIKHTKAVRPWAGEENEQLYKDSRSVVFPTPNYDTLPHQS